MWIFTPDGFYSIVTAAEFGEEVQVRARSEDDLKRLRDHWLPQLGPTIVKPHRDYPCRAFCTKTDLAEGLSRLALEVDYDNFKDTVAARHSTERSHVYAKVWSVCRTIENVKTIASNPEGLDDSGINMLVLPERTQEYRARDLVGEGVWPAAGNNLRYGGVVFDPGGQVLLREPANHFDGYVWTFSKGKPEPGEHPVDAALRETLEETGCRPVVVGHLSRGFAGGVTKSVSCFYLMVDRTGTVDNEAVVRDKETATVRWVLYDEARNLIGKTTNDGGRARDLAILSASFEEIRRLAHAASATS